MCICSLYIWWLSFRIPAGRVFAPVIKWLILNIQFSAVFASSQMLNQLVHMSDMCICTICIYYDRLFEPTDSHVGYVFVYLQYLYLLRQTIWTNWFTCRICVFAVFVFVTTDYLLGTTITDHYPDWVDYSLFSFSAHSNFTGLNSFMCFRVYFLKELMGYKIHALTLICCSFSPCSVSQGLI